MSKIEALADVPNVAPLNGNNDKIETAFQNTLSRDGSTPNQMEANLDMNNNRILNLPDAVHNQEPITLAQAANIASVSVAFSRENVGAVLYPVTQAETDNSITPENYYYPPGDVRRYGAAVDGSTDDTAAIQAAFNIGGDVILPPGSYKVTSQISLVSGVRITGEGATITYSGSMASASTFSGSSLSDIEIRGIKFVGSRTNDAGTYLNGSAISCTSVDDLTIENCNISGFPNSGIVLKDCERFKILHNKITDIVPVSSGNGAAAISINDDCLDGLIEGNHIEDIGSASVLAHGIRVIVQVGTVIAKKLRIIGNTIKTIGGHGITLYDGASGSTSDGSVISDNVIDTTGVTTAASEERGNGIYLLSVDGVAITGNTIIDACTASTGPASIGQGGIVVVSGDSAATNKPVSIVGNTIENSRFAGIRVQALTGCTISGNVVNGYTTYGIRASGELVQFAITGNTLRATAAASALGGISFGANVGGCVRGTVAGNTIDCVSQGFGIEASSVDDVTITGNTIYEPATNGISLVGVDRVLVTGNTVYSTTAACVAYRSSSDACTLSKIEAGMANNRATYDAPYVVNAASAGLQVITSGSDAPDQGTWAAGDVCWNTATTAGGAPGWVCTVAGSPGTWNAMASVAS